MRATAQQIIVGEQQPLDLGLDLTPVGTGSTMRPPAMPTYAETSFRDRLTAACAAHAGIGPGVLVLHDVTTKYLESDVVITFANPAIQRNAGWSRGSLLDCYPMHPHFRWLSELSKGTWPILGRS